MKDTIQNYGWIVITLIVLSIMIALASPFATAVADNIMMQTDNLGDVAKGPSYVIPYSVKLQKNNPKAGVVSFTEGYDGDKIFLKGENIVKFKATPSEGYEFAGWYIDNNLISKNFEHEHLFAKQTVIIAKFAPIHVHEFNIEAATCNTAKFCLICNEIVQEATNNHSYTTEITEPTATENGQKLNKCIHCDYSESEEIVPLEYEITSGNRGNIGYTTSITELNIPAVFLHTDGNWYRVAKIADSAFSGCTNLVSVTIPSTVTTIGNNAFYKCTSLTNVVIDDGVTSLGSSVFNDCTNLKNIVIPNSVTSVGSFLFQDCIGLTSVGLVGSGASVELSNNITSYPRQLFGNCTNITEVVMSDNVITVDEEAFIRCTRLTFINLSDNLTTLGDLVFYESGLKEIVLHDSLQSIGKQAFMFCGLTSITLPANLTTLGDYAFKACENMTTVIFKGTAEEWASVEKGANWNDRTKITSVTCTGSGSNEVVPVT